MRFALVGGLLALLLLLTVGVVARALHGGPWAQKLIRAALVGLRLWRWAAGRVLPAGAFAGIGLVPWGQRSPTRPAPPAGLPEGTAYVMATAVAGAWELGPRARALGETDRWYRFAPSGVTARTYPGTV